MKHESRLRRLEGPAHADAWNLITLLRYVEACQQGQPVPIDLAAPATGPLIECLANLGATHGIN